MTAQINAKSERKYLHHGCFAPFPYLIGTLDAISYVDCTASGADLHSMKLHVEIVLK